MEVVREHRFIHIQVDDPSDPLALNGHTQECGPCKMLTPVHGLRIGLIHHFTFPLQGLTKRGHLGNTDYMFK